MKMVRSVKLRDSKLCLDCETIYSGRACPTCASEASMPLARIVAGKSANRLPPIPPQYPTYAAYYPEARA